jgi:hypothetical protein
MKSFIVIANLSKARIINVRNWEASIFEIEAASKKVFGGGYKNFSNN